MIDLGICQSNLLYTLLECYEGCSECTSLGKNGCTDCEEDYFFFEGQCLDKCPEGTYLIADEAICSACPPECELCRSELECTKCSNSFYLLDNACVSKCPLGTYGNGVVGECSACHDACSACSGATSHDCLECSYEAGYTRSSKGSASCYLMPCPEGTYLNVSTGSEAPNCLPCDSACRACKGEGRYNCTACSKGLALITLASENKTFCTSCPSGFSINSKGVCIGNFFH